MALDGYAIEKPEERLLTRKSKSSLQIQKSNYLNFRNLYLGSLENLPPIYSKAIKIFLSSTFSDMAVERNALMKSVYLKLRDYCRDRYGIEFQITDMRWGIREESQLDHEASDICFQEVINCQNISTGPNFVAMLGQRYGNHPPPAKITKTVFVKIKEIINDLNEDVDVIDAWYLCDTNNSPHMFRLKPVIDVLTSENLTYEEIEEAKTSWRKAEVDIQRKFMKATTHGLQTKRLTDEQASIFSCSVTEREIQLGILNVESKFRDRTFTFIRNIEDIDNHITHSKAYKFIDLKSDSTPMIDNDLRQKMTRLKEVQIPQVVSQSQMKSYSVQWTDGINESDHKSYLDIFCRDFYQEIRSLIDQAAVQKRFLEEDDLYTEVLQHSTACIHFVKHFQGREDLLDKIKEYILGDSNEPLIVHGASGSGKTSVLAKAASLCQSWLGESHNGLEIVLLVRFLGTSPGTSSIRQTLKYVCRQMVMALHREEEMDTIQQLDSLKDIKDKFYELIKSVEEDSRTVVIFLDSVDQLNSSDSAYQLNWLQNRLPKRVKLVLSTLTDMYNLLDTFKAKFENSSCFVEVKPLEENFCMKIVRSLLAEKNRELTEKQCEIVISAFKECSLPIYVNLVFHQVVNWRSYETSQHVLRIEATIRGAIRQLFHNMEMKYGKILTRHSLAYITASRNGISEVELEDLLSLDDDVLRDVFQYHLPPQIRIPSFCWSRLRNDIGSHLVEREADNTRVIYWYHRQFIQVATEYFLGDKEFLQKIHSNMADYFLGIWGGGKKKEFVYPQKLIKKLGLPASNLEDRRVPPQPYILEGSSGSEGMTTQRFNLRKLNELPFHLVYAHRLEEFYDQLAFDYEFLFNKLRSMSRHDLLVDLSLPFQIIAASEVPTELRKLINAIRIASQSLLADPISLNTDLIGRLFNFEKDSPRIKRLLDECRSIGLRDCALIPLHNCFESGSGVLQTSIDLKIGFAFVSSSGMVVVLGLENNDVRIIDLDGNELYSFTAPYNLIMCSRVLFKTGIPSSMICNLALSIPPEDNENGSPKIICLRVNFKTGYSNVLFHLPPSWLKLDLSDLNFSGEHWILLSNSFFAHLISIDRQELVSSVKGSFTVIPAITHDERYFFYADNSKHGLITLLDGGNQSVKLIPNQGDLSGYIISALTIDNDQVYMLIQSVDGSDKLYALVLRIYEIITCDEHLELKFMNEIDFDYKMYKIIKSQSFISDKYVVFLFKQSSTLKEKLWVVERENKSFLNLNDPNSLLNRADINSLDKEFHLRIIDKYDFLITSLIDTLFGVFHLKTGQFIRKIKMGNAKGFIGGISTDSNLLLISHFPDETEKHENDRMFIMGKVFNLAVIAEEYRSNQNTSDESPENKHFECDNLKVDIHFMPGRNDLMKKIVGENSWILDLKNFKSHSVADNDLENYLKLNLPLEDQYRAPVLEDDFVVNFNQKIGNCYSLEKYQRLPQKIRCTRYSTRALNVNYILPDPRSKTLWKIFVCNNTLSITKWEKQESSQSSDGVAEDISKDEEDSIRLICKLLVKEDNFLEDMVNFTSPLYDKQSIENVLMSRKAKKEMWCVRLILERPCHPLQLIVFLTENIKLTEATKADMTAVLYLGKVNIYNFSGLTTTENDSELPLLHSQIFDSGTTLAFFQDGVHAINYKLHIYNIESGQLVRRVVDTESHLDMILLATFLLTPDDKYLVAQFMTRPFKITTVYDTNKEVMYSSPPPRFLQIYRLSDGRQLANYMMENEPAQLITSLNEQLLVILSLSEKLRVFKIDDGLRKDQAIFSTIDTSFIDKRAEVKKSSEPESISKPTPHSSNYLESIGISSILSEAFVEVIERRPADPIEFIAKFLHSRNCNP